MKTMIYILTCVLAMLFIGCTYYTPYLISLKEVERSDVTVERYGGNKVEVVDTLGIKFEDDLLRIIWIPTKSRFNFTLSNKTQHSMKIIWDEAIYVNEVGISQGVTHLGVKYTDHSISQPPSVVIRDGLINDFVLPSDNIYYSSGWVEKALFPNISDSKSISLIKAEKYIGSTVQILLPIEIQGTVNEYIFTFEVEGIVLP